MCGHATLATAALIFDRIEPEATELSFQTMSGELLVRRHADGSERLTLDFPAHQVGERVEEAPSALVAAVGAAPAECYRIPPLHVGSPYFLFL